MPIIHNPKTPWQLAAYPLKYAGVGSRDTPTDVLDVMRRLGKALCNIGYLGMSGEADGADFAFHEGARQSTRYDDVGFGAFLPYNGMRTGRGVIYEDISRGIYDASKFDNWERARQFAFEARGSFNGLGRGGVALHTRNAFQVLSPSLQDPVKRLICWAQPIGTRGQVKGGTNTAVQIAHRYNIPVVNLLIDDQMQNVLRFLSQVECDQNVDTGSQKGLASRHNT